ncbi:MAG: hypothetical protein V1789_12245, partial [PVC group bacterium]
DNLDQCPGPGEMGGGLLWVCVTREMMISYSHLPETPVSFKMRRDIDRICSSRNKILAFRIIKTEGQIDDKPGGPEGPQCGHTGGKKRARFSTIDGRSSKWNEAVKEGA